MSKTKAPSSALPRRVWVEPGIYRRPSDGELEVGWRDADGKQRWRVIPGRRIKACRIALAEEIARRGRGERLSLDPRLRFRRGSEAWWLARVLRLAENTQNAYGAALRHLLQAFGNRRLIDITVTELVAYLNKKAAEGLKGWTLRGHLTVVSAIFRYAYRHLGVLTQNPVALLDKIERPSNDDEKPHRILDTAELADLLAAVDDDYTELFELAAETGMRLSEVLAVQWHELELDPDEASVDIRYQLRRGRRGRPARRVKLKTKRSRRVLEITAGLAARLAARKARSKFNRPHDYAFANQEGRPLDQRNVGGRVLARAVKKAGLETVFDINGEIALAAPTFHDLRHTHASRLIAAGWDIEEISSRLGHATAAITLRIYVHEFERARRSKERRARLTLIYGDSSVEASVEARDGDSPSQTAEPSTLEPAA